MKMSMDLLSQSQRQSQIVITVPGQQNYIKKPNLDLMSLVGGQANNISCSEFTTTFANPLRTDRDLYHQQ